MHKLRLCLVAASLLWPSLVSAKMPAAVTARQRAEHACYNNVMKFCNDEVPDEAKIAACMGRNVAKLDPDCRAAYEQGVK